MKKRVLISFFSICLSPLPSHASEYQALKNCGEAKVSDGDTCSNVKVQFNLKSCDQKTEAVQAKKIICKGTQIKARYDNEDTRFEVEFNKEIDPWGSVVWTSLGPVRKLKKIKPAVASHHNETNIISREPAQSPTTTPSTPLDNATTLGSFKFSGFFDARYTDFVAKKNPLVANSHAESGFGLEDGAFYANYEKNKILVVADLPFRRGKDIDYNTAATTPNQSSNGNIVFGVDKAQLYLKYKATENFLIDMGQFDTIFGVELNDSKDRVFNRAGLVYEATLPVTHTGLMLEYSRSGAYTKIFAANPNNKGSYGTSTTKDENTEYGGAIGYSNDLVRCQIGYMSRSILRADLLKTENRTLADGTFGLTLGPLSLDFEYAIVTDPSKNTLTSTDAADSESAGTGSFVLVNYKVTEALSLGLRYEALDKDPSSLSLQTATSSGANLQYKVDSNLSLKTEFIGYDYKTVSEEKWHDSRFSFATLVSF